MAQYLARKNKLFYEVAKFDDSDDAVAVYKFTARGCTCPSGRRGCKHVAILNTWKASGEVPGAVYNDSAELVSHLNVI